MLENVKGVELKNVKVNGKVRNEIDHALDP